MDALQAATAARYFALKQRALVASGSANKKHAALAQPCAAGAFGVSDKKRVHESNQNDHGLVRQGRSVVPDHDSRGRRGEAARK